MAQIAHWISSRTRCGSGQAAMNGENMKHVLDVRELVVNMCRHIGEEFPASPFEMKMRQGLSLAEEAGEAVGALRRYLGAARRSGTREELEDELADVVFSAYILAHYVDSDLDVAIVRKAKRIFTRGWREGSTQDLERNHA